MNNWVLSVVGCGIGWLLGSSLQRRDYVGLFVGIVSLTAFIYLWAAMNF